MATARNSSRAAAAKPGAEPETTTYEVLSNIDHDGEPYGPGDSIELDRRAADALLAVGAIKAAAKAASEA